MATDASVYANFKPVDYFGAYQRGVDSAGESARLSDLAKQRDKQKAIEGAYSKNVGADGTVNQQGVLSDIAKSGYGREANELKGQFATQDAETQKRKQEFAHRQMTAVGERYDALAGMDDQQRAVAWPKIKADLVSQGIINPKDSPDQYDPQYFAGTHAQLMQYRNSPEFLAREKSKAETEHLRAQAYKDRQESKNPKKSLSPGQEKADEAFGKDLADYYYGGGKATTEKNIERLGGAINKLKENPGITGGISTRLPLLGSDSAQDTINPEMASVRDEIRSAIQGSLRQTLGAQFTEKEGEAIFNRAFNPRLSAEENVKRATAEMEGIKRMAAQKDASMQHFMANGTLKDYRPPGTQLGPSESAPSYAAEKPASGSILGGSVANAAPAAIKPKSQRTSQDMEAMHWARKNKSDPRAQQILQMHGEQ